VAALFGEAFVRGSLIVEGDATATANNILGSETLFRAGLAGEMLTCVCDVALAMILYVLLKPVSRNLALLAAFFRLTFVAIYGVAKLFEIAALVVLGRADYLQAFEPRQLHALAYMSLRVHGLGYGVSLLFFGFCCVLVGTLIHKSGYRPGSSASCWSSEVCATSSSAWRRCWHRPSPRGGCSPGSCCPPSPRNWGSACGSW
jgi:hypothetical protein